MESLNPMACEHCRCELRAIPNRDYFQCSGCGKYVFSTALDDPAEPIELTGQPVHVNCPKCRCGLEFAILHGRWRVCFCKTCRGFVIDSGCLGVIVHELRAHYCGEDSKPVPLNPDELDEHRSCPACDQWMETHPYYGPGTAVINSCAHCKVTWMDHRELSSIICAPGFRHDRNSSPVSQTLNPSPKEIQDDSLEIAGKVIIQAATGFMF